MRIETPNGAKPSIRFEETDMSDDLDFDLEGDTRLTNDEEDALLRESTSSFADWISNFIRRVTLLLDNLPEEGPDGSSRGSETESRFELS